MFLVWYLYHTYRASVEENEEVYRAYESTTFNNITEKKMNVETCLDERTITGLVLSTLRKIGCEPQMEQQGSNYVYFTYQGENFTIECNDESFYINIYDTWWHGISIYSDVEEIANLHRVVNIANQYAYCTLLYTTNKEIEEIGVHSKKNILFIKEIPELDKYLIGTLDDFFKVQRFVLTELEKCKVTENK
jgi:hypothetical protein